MIDQLDNAMVNAIANDVIDNTRTMAIEFEFFCHTDKVHLLKGALKDAVTMHEKTYMQALGRAFPCWIWKTDGSLRQDQFRSPYIQRNYKGFELTSPCNLTFKDLVQQMKAVLHYMNEYKCKVNISCGTHVHHVGTRFTAKRLQNLSNFAVANEKAIDGLVSESRRGNQQWTKSNKDILDCGSWCEQKRSTSFMESKGIQNTQDVRVSQSDHYRYRHLNLTAFGKHGTIEFRQHQGTLDFSKAVFWLAFTQSQVLRGLKSVKQVANYQQPMFNTLTSLKWGTDDRNGALIPCSKGHEYLLKFLVGRMNKFGRVAPRLSNLPIR
tara:strand:- start:176 stop:1144 length:969 start_codon:yes stop_codon:yes gene_type:complete